MKARTVYFGMAIVFAVYALILELNYIGNSDQLLLSVVCMTCAALVKE